MIAVAIVAFVSRDETGSGAGSGTVAGAGKPNILVIMTDDQTLESMKVMSNTRSLLADNGTTFSNFYVSFPNCCPSRATYLTGQYAHNHGVKDNLPPDGGFEKLDSAETLPVWLQRAGYYTASIGKYLNTWGQASIEPPPGWSHWFGLIDPTTYHYFNYSVSNDGRRQEYGSAEQDYQTDVLGAEVKRTITEAGTSGRPWFVTWTPLAPHAQYSERSSERISGSGEGLPEVDATTLPVPPARFKGTLASEPLPKPPNYNEQVVGTPSLVQQLPPITEEPLLEQSYRAELESLLAVDEWVGSLVSTVQETGQLDRTVIIFMSDNGNFHGEFRLPYGKVLLYEAASHVPLIIRGGPFAKGATVDAVTVNADIAPTILALAGASPTLALDGRDLTQIARDPVSGRGRAVLLESWLNQGKSGRLHMSAVHDDRYVLMRDSTGFVSLYDLSTDPYQMHNRVDDPSLATVKADLEARLDKLSSCAGQSCW